MEDSDEPVPGPFLKLKMCERMGWLFSEYEEQPADEITQAWAMWNIEAKARDGVHPDDGWGEWEDD